MRVRGKGATLIAGEELRSPPLPFLDLDDTEALALIGIGVAEEVKEDGSSLEQPEPDHVVIDTPAGDSGDSGTNPAPAVEGAPAADAVADEASVGADGGASQEPEASATGSTPSADASASERQVNIRDMFELLDANDLVKTGARAGKPKVSAIEEATGFTDVTAEEIDALWDARAV